MFHQIVDIICTWLDIYCKKKTIPVLALWVLWLLARVCFIYDIYFATKNLFSLYGMHTNNFSFRRMIILWKTSFENFFKIVFYFTLVLIKALSKSQHVFFKCLLYKSLVFTSYPRKILFFFSINISIQCQVKNARD